MRERIFIRAAALSKLQDFGSKDHDGKIQEIQEVLGSHITQVNVYFGRM